MTPKRTTPLWIAGLAALLVVAGFVLLQQAPDAVATRSAKGETVAVEPELPVPIERRPDVAVDAPEAPAPTSLAEFTDAPLARLTGRVLDQAGAPVGGVRVILLDTRDKDDVLVLLRRLVRPSSRWVTARDGTFRIDAPLDGACLLALAPPGGAVQFAAELALLPDKTVELGDLVLSPATEVTGLVCDEQRHPIAGAEVLLTDATSFLAGLVSMAGAPGWDLVGLDIVPDEDSLQSFLRSLPQSVLLRTGADGRFSAPLVTYGESDAQVGARARGFTLSFVQHFDPAAAIVLRPAPARLAGRVTSADGSPPPRGTFVQARSVATEGLPRFGRVVRAEPDGRFEIPGLTEERYELVAASSDSLPSEALTFAAGTLDARLVLRPRVELLLHVTHDGDPVDEFDVTLGGEPHVFQPPPRATSRHAGPGAAGRLRLTEVGTSAMTVQAFAGKLCSLPMKAVPSDEQPHVELTLPLDEGCLLIGGVVEQGGTVPVTGARVRVRSAGPGARCDVRAVTDRQGAFTLGPFPHGTLSVQVIANGFAEAKQDIEADGAFPLVIELQRRAVVQVRLGSVLRAALAGSTRHPLDSGIHVQAVAVDSKRDQVVRELRPTGVFFDELAPGRYRLEVNGARSDEFTVVAGELLTFDF